MALWTPDPMPNQQNNIKFNWEYGFCYDYLMVLTNYTLEYHKNTLILCSLSRFFFVCRFLSMQRVINICRIGRFCSISDWMSQNQQRLFVDRKKYTPPTALFNEIFHVYKSKCTMGIITIIRLHLKAIHIAFVTWFVFCM